MTRLIAVAPLAVLLACAASTRVGQAESYPSPAASAAAAPAPIVDTKNFAYKPSSLEVHVGEAVLFKNSDPLPHTVTANDKSFDSGDMPQGATWRHVFTKPGVYAYTCTYHPFMKGKIIVKR